MGGGSWTRTAYDSRTTSKLADHGTAFVHDKATKSTPRHTWAASKILDPKSTNSAGVHDGLIMRESLDSDEHPESVPIAVIFDVTGSMGGIPKVLQTKLPNLHGLLQRKGYVEHPQILFGAVGDAYSDRVPLQIGQFESDNRMGEQLEEVLLEGGGGGGNHESYELAAYYLAHHTYLDSWTKRGKKGYVFFIGDECAYANLSRTAVETYIGDTLQEDMKTADVFAELQERYEVFYLFAEEGNYTVALTLDAKGDSMRAGWRELLGQNALTLQRADAVCETIALTVGIMEGTVTLDEGLADLKEVGSDLASIEAAGTALSTVAASASVTVAEGEIATVDGAAGGVETV